MSDPIRAALEAAWKAECTARARVNECDENPCRRACRWCGASSAAAVAAFLRALPACDVMMERNSWEGGPHSTHTLADAVERAAKD